MESIRCESSSEADHHTEFWTDPILNGYESKEELLEDLGMMIADVAKYNVFWLPQSGEDSPTG